MEIGGVLVVCVVVAVSSVIAYYAIYAEKGAKALSPTEWSSFKLLQKTKISRNCYRLRFALWDKNSSLNISNGQHVVVGLKQDKIVARNYTPVTDAGQKGYFELVIKSYENGTVSKYLGNLNANARVLFKGPKGKYRYAANSHKKMLMLAGGTGLTPMYQLIRAITQSKCDATKAVLLYANEEADDILLKSELDKLAAGDSRFQVEYVLNKPPAGWTGHTGFISEALVRTHVSQPHPDTQVLICGPPPMVNAMERTLVSIGYDALPAVSKPTDPVFKF